MYFLFPSLSLSLSLSLPPPPSLPSMHKQKEGPVNLEVIMLSEMSVREIQKYHMISLICGIERTIQMNKQNRNRLTEQTNGCEGRGLAEKGEGTGKYTLADTKQPWRCKVQHRENSQ